MAKECIGCESEHIRKMISEHTNSEHIQKMSSKRKKKLSRMQSRKEWICGQKNTCSHCSSNSDDQKGSDMSTANCYSLSNSENQMGSDMSTANCYSLLSSADFKGSDMSTLKSCSPSNADDQKGSDMSTANCYSLSNSENQKGSDMSTANCYSLFSSYCNESDGKLLSSNSADFKGSDMSTLKSISPFEGLDLDRFLNDVLKKMVIKPISYEKSSDAPELALEYYKRVKKGGDYELVDSVLALPTSGFGSHINFFARLKGKDSPPEFFFAELKAGSPREVVDCCIINPKPYSFGETPPPRLALTHCKHVNCDECEVWAYLNLDGRGEICV